MALPPGRMRRKCSHAPRFHHHPETAWQQNMERLWPVPIVWFLDPQLEHGAAPPKPLEDTMLAFMQF